MYLKIVYKGKKIGGLEFNPKVVLKEWDEGVMEMYEEFGLDETVEESLTEYFFQELEYIIVEDKQQDEEVEQLRLNAADKLKAWANK